LKEYFSRNDATAQREIDMEACRCAAAPLRETPAST